MAKKNKLNRTKQNYPIGKQTLKQEPEKNSDFYTKHKSTFWTIIVLVILTIFFIINNTRKVPDEGPYPPNYLNENSSEGIQE